MSEGTCKNCGYDRGLHHYQTMQCPVGGEAPIGRKQEWMTQTFEKEDNSAAIIAILKCALEDIAYGPVGKSVAVKNIAKSALAKVQS